MKCQFSKADIIKMSRVIDEHLFVMFGGRGFQQTRSRFSVSQVRVVQSLVSHIVFLSFLSNILFDCLQ